MDELVTNRVLLRPPSQKHELMMGTSLHPQGFVSSKSQTLTSIRHGQDAFISFLATSYISSLVFCSLIYSTSVLKVRRWSSFTCALKYVKNCQYSDKFP
jgi:hypothetical protein